MPDGTAYYDLARNPPSFNFLDFMLEAEKWRIKEEIPRIKFSILPGPMNGFRRDCLPPNGEQERIRWLNNIVIPMARLLPSCGEEARINYQATEGKTLGRDKYLIGLSALMDSAQKDMYVLRAPADEIDDVKDKYGRYVTITIRDTGWWVERTTNVSEWLIVAKELQTQGFRVVFVPDGMKPDTIIEGYDCDREASCNSLKRAALYQGSEMNFGIPNGPLWMCMFLGAPLMMVKMVNENEPSTTASSYIKIGLNPGKQMPNAKPRQMILWEKEDASVILKTFESLMR